MPDCDGGVRLGSSAAEALRGEADPITGSVGVGWSISSIRAILSHTPTTCGVDVGTTASGSGMMSRRAPSRSIH